MSTEISIEQTNTLIPQEDQTVRYQVRLNVVASVGAPLQLFVFGVLDDTYNHPATLYDVDMFPASKEEAVTLGVDYYRTSEVTRLFSLLADALEFSSMARARLRRTVNALNTVGLSFAGVQTHTITSREALVRELAHVREQGWAIVDQELEEGLRSIAVPILHSSGTVIAAINVSTTASSHTVESIHDNLLPPLQIAAERISKDLTASRPFSQPKTSGISPS